MYMNTILLLWKVCNSTIRCTFYANYCITQRVGDAAFLQSLLATQGLNASPQQRLDIPTIAL